MTSGCLWCLPAYYAYILLNEPILYNFNMCDIGIQFYIEIIEKEIIWLISIRIYDYYLYIQIYIYIHIYTHIYFLFYSCSISDLYLVYITFICSFLLHSCSWSHFKLVYLFLYFGYILKVFVSNKDNWTRLYNNIWLSFTLICLFPFLF